MNQDHIKTNCETTVDQTATCPPRQKSPARVAAGQRNGRLAAGKKSEEGKAASSQNAFNHGYHARAFSVLPTENRDYFDKLAQSLLAELKPASQRQSLLAQQIIRYHWLLQRNFRLEEAMLTSEIVSQHNSRPEDVAIPNTLLATSYAFDAVVNRNQTLNTIYRHRGQIQRELTCVQKQFDDLQSKESSTALGAAKPPLRACSDDMFLPEISVVETKNSSNEGNGADHSVPMAAEHPTNNPAPPPNAALLE